MRFITYLFCKTWHVVPRLLNMVMAVKTTPHVVRVDGSQTHPPPLRNVCDWPSRFLSGGGTQTFRYASGRNSTELS